MKSFLFSTFVLLLCFMSCTERHGGDYMHQRLMMYDAMNKAYENMAECDSINEVVDYYDTWGNTNEKMHAHYLLGCAYRDKGDSPSALKHYNDAVTMADTTRSDCDFNMMACIYGQMAEIYDDQTSFLHELEMEKKSVEMSLKARDTIDAYKNMTYMAYTYQKLNMPDSAIHISQNLRKQFQKRGLHREASMLLYPIMKSYQQKGEVGKIGNMLRELEKESKLFSKGNYIEEGREIYYELKADYFLENGETDSAKHYYQRLLNTEYKNCQEAGLKGMMMLHARNGNFGESTMYALAYSRLRDSMVLVRASDDVNRQYMIYNYEFINQQKWKAEKESRTMAYVMIALTVTVALIAYIIFVAIRRRRNEYRKLMADESNKYAHLLFKYNKTQNELDGVRNDIEEFKNSKNAEIEEMRKQLSAYNDNLFNPESWDSERKLITCDILKHVHEIASCGETVTVYELSLIKELINSSLPALADIINNPSNRLSEQEINVCILVRLCFIPSEISTLLNITNQRVTNIRSALNKKLFSQDGAKSLNTNLMGIK